MRVSILCYLAYQSYGDIFFEVVGSSIMQKVFGQFATIYIICNVASMVVESNVAFCFTFPYVQ